MMISRSLSGAIAALVLASGAAFAQEAPAAAPQRAAGPPDIKMVGDWAVRCFQVQSVAPCDMYQEMQDQRTQQRVLSVSIAFVPSLNRHGIQIAVPLETSIAKGVVIQTSSYKSPVLKYSRCDRSGCFVEMPVDNDAIASLAKSSKEAKVIVVADSTNKPVELRFSLNGFAGAQSQMAEQARAKATKPAAAPAAPAAPAP
ncbi:MAG TPA: invasion associated locus B family protein [Rhizomicrobium sp.]|jgi:invasion protein IalB|nr:invasion associated locus B family protein [Rhizomicrobium sp.]